MFYRGRQRDGALKENACFLPACGRTAIPWIFFSYMAGNTFFKNTRTKTTTKSLQKVPLHQHLCCPPKLQEGQSIAGSFEVFGKIYIFLFKHLFRILKSAENHFIDHQYCLFTTMLTSTRELHSLIPLLSLSLFHSPWEVTGNLCQGVAREIKK